MDWLFFWKKQTIQNKQFEAQTLLEKANELDGYETSCMSDWCNKKAREGMNYRAWNDQSLAKEVEEMDSTIRCVIMDPSADGGMPHTREPNIVCIPAYFPKEKLPVTLRHEKAHIDQRKNTEIWLEKCKRDGWEQIEDSVAIREIPTTYVRRCRFNPDTLYVRWMAWEGRYIPLPLFLRDDKPILRDIEVRWWDRVEKRLLTKPPTSFQKRYGESVSQAKQEHPFELYAYIQENHM